MKIRGNRVELGAIEATLSAHPAVEQCADKGHVHHRIGYSQAGEQQVEYLQDHPGAYNIKRRNAEHSSTLQFGQQAHDVLVYGKFAIVRT